MPTACLQPQSPEAYANLASAYKDCGRHDEALGSYRQALHLRSDFPEAFANYVHSLMCVCEWGDRPALFARQAAADAREAPRGACVACGAAVAAKNSGQRSVSCACSPFFPTQLTRVNNHLPCHLPCSAPQAGG